MAEAIVVNNISAAGGEDTPTSKIYGIRIDMSSSDPSTAVVYTDAARDFAPLGCQSNGTVSWGDWRSIIEDVIGCRPCLYKNGTVADYLNPDNYAQLASGGSADITSGNAGDVMIEFKKLWYQWRVSGNYLYFRITGQNMDGDSEWTTTAFNAEDGTGMVRDAMYYSAYEGYANGNKLRSLSGKSPSVNATIGQFRTWATANGSKYQQETIAKRMYIIGLIFLVTKSRESQLTVGLGYVSGNSGPATTGTQNTKGLFYGTTSGSVVAKVFGIENFWGSLYHWCEGIISGGGTTAKLKVNGPYNDNGSGYTTVSGLTNSGGQPSIMTPAMEGSVILASQVSGSSYMEYFPDYWLLDSGAGCVCRVGGRWNSDRLAGPLFCYVYYSTSGTLSSIGGRLVAA